MSRAVRLVAGAALIVASIYVPGLSALAVQALFATGASLALGAILQPKPGTLERLQAQSVMVRSAVAPQQIVYGRDKKSGVVVYFDTSGPENQYLWFVVAVVEHEIDGYETLWIDATAIDIATEIDVDGYVTHTKFIDADGNKLVKAMFYTGAAGQTADAELVAAFGDWTVDHKGEGVAYFWVRLQLDRSEGGSDPNNPNANVWAKGWPRDLAVTLRGAKVYDPRLDDLNGGTGTQRADTPSTWAWSENSILCRTDYLRSTRFGPGYLSSEITWATVATHADICDQLVSLPASGDQKRYTLNGVVTVDEQPKSILESMQTADHGVTLFLPGGIEVRAGAWEASSHTIDETWLAGGFSSESALPTDDAYNAVRGQYVSAADDYAVIEFAPRTSGAYETEDGIGRVWQDIVLPFTREEFAAQRLAIIELKKSRQQTRAKAVCNFRGELVQVYQIVTLNIAGYTGKTFRVLGRSQSTDGTTTLDLREEVASDWSYTIPELATPPIIPSVVRYPDGVPAPTALVATAGFEGVHLTWAHPNMAAISHIEVYAADTNDRSGAVLVTKTLTESYFHALTEGTTKYYWILARGLNGLVSQWYPEGATAGATATAGGAATGDDGLSIAELSIYQRAAIAPVTPTGGSYDFGTQILTPPAGWSSAIPSGNDPVYVCRGVASVQGTTGTDNTITWSAPVKALADGESVDIIFRRSATQPDTPAPSAGVPTGWYTDVNSVPAGPDPIWASVGTRENAGQDWTWQTPVKIEGGDAVLYYIKPTNGTAIKNGTGTLTVEAHKVVGGTDALLSTGTIQLYVGAVLVTTANGYVTGSDGYTGIFDSGDITGDVVVTLKDGAGGSPLDSITLVDIADGLDGDNAVYGFIEPSGPLAWTRAADQTTWTPSATTVDLDVTFVQGGVTVARDAIRVTRSSDGLLTASATTHPLGDYNTTRITITNNGSNTQSLGVKFSYSHGAASAALAETVITSMAGSDGLAGLSIAELAIYRRLTSTPSTPSGGSYNFGTQTLTPPTNWSSSIPAGDDPIWTSRAVASVVGQTGTDNVLAWSSPVKIAQQGEGVDIIFRRSASQPSTPAPSAGTPANWYTDVNSVPAGANPMWSSVGTRLNAGQLWVWQTPVKIEGQDGASGDDAIASQLTNPAMTVSSASDGTGYSLTGTGGTHQVSAGAIDVTTSATHSVVSPATKNGLTMSVNSSGVYSLSGASWTSDQENFTLRAVYGGVTLHKTYSIAKAKAGGGGGGGSANCVVNGGSAIATGTTPWAQWLFSTDGNEYSTIEGASAVNRGAWKLVGAVGDYEIYAFRYSDSGSYSLTGTLDAWQALSTNRSWRIDVASGTGTINLQVQIRNASTKVLEASGFVTLRGTDTS